MSVKSDVRCPHCAPRIEKYGEGYHRVYDQAGSQICEVCGGIHTDGIWVYRCRSCKKTVDPGGLRGLFVPHKCEACEEALAAREKASGNVCGMCRSPRSRCCC